MLNILYYTWGEMTKDDAVNALRKMGHNVILHTAQFDKYDNDDKNISSVISSLEKSGNTDIIFSYNYFPDVARVAKDKNIPYVSWVWDNPHLTLESETLGFETNKVFVFDSGLVEKYRNLGIGTVSYSPLPAKTVNSVRNIISYDHEITFVGTMYDGDKDQYGQIGYLPDELKGYLDGLMTAQFSVPGYDIMDEPLCRKADEIAQYVKTSLGQGYRKCDIEIFGDIMRKRLTMYDRMSIIKMLGNHFDVGLYCEKNQPNLPVKYEGIVSNDDFPNVIAKSKINLNITLRSIRKGIPHRVIHILGAGGFCLTDYKEDMAGLFEDGKDIAWYYSPEELFDKCSFYLQNEDARKKVAAEGLETARKRLSYEKLFSEIFSVLN